MSAFAASQPSKIKQHDPSSAVAPLTHLDVAHLLPQRAQRAVAVLTACAVLHRRRHQLPQPPQRKLQRETRATALSSSPPH